MGNDGQSRSGGLPGFLGAFLGVPSCPVRSCRGSSVWPASQRWSSLVGSPRRLPGGSSGGIVFVSSAAPVTTLSHNCLAGHRIHSAVNSGRAEQPHSRLWILCIWHRHCTCEVRVADFKQESAWKGKGDIFRSGRKQTRQQAVLLEPNFLCSLDLGLRRRSLKRLPRAGIEQG